jgi:putative peptide zinc metalloprotease protein
MKRLVPILVAACLFVGGPAFAGSTAPDNSVVVVNTMDNTQKAKSGFKIERVSGDTVDEQNAAWAESSCNDCRAVAVATQVLLAGDNPSNVTPKNYAFAVNDQCTNCETLAEAYQFVIFTDGPVYFTQQGSDEITQIRHDMRDAAHSDASLDDIRARLDSDASELQTVLQEQLVESGRSGQVEEHSDDQSG